MGAWMGAADLLGSFRKGIWLKPGLVFRVGGWCKRKGLVYLLEGISVIGRNV